MTDDKWSSLHRRMVEPIEVEAMVAAEPGFDLTDPAVIGVNFIRALADTDESQDILTKVVTPESLTSWGDFTSAANFLNSIENWGVGSMPTPSVADPEVVYMTILSGVTQSFRAVGEQMVMPAGVVTLVWRLQYGMWMVHAIGDDYFPAERVPKDFPPQNHRMTHASKKGQPDHAKDAAP